MTDAFGPLEAPTPTTPPTPPPPTPSAMPLAATAGWYPDSSPGVLRYWDGTAWTDHRAAATQQTVQSPPASAGYPPVLPPVVGYVAPVGPQPFGEGDNMVFVGHQVCTPWERFAAYLIDGALMLVTLYIGWLIWACITAGDGQTPGKKLLGQRVFRLDSGRPATFGWMFAMRGLVGNSIFTLSMYVLVGLVLVFMPFWDKKNQTVIDKISSTVVLKVAT